MSDKSAFRSQINFLNNSLLGEIINIFTCICYLASFQTSLVGNFVQRSH